MKNSILENGQEIVNNLNSTLTGYTIEGINTVARGRGVSKTLLQVTISSNEWIANITFNTESFYIEKVIVLGEKNKSVIDSIDTEICFMFDNISKVIKEVVNSNVTPEVTEVVENNINTVEIDTNNNDITYTVANKSFKTYDQALSYCNANDFDAEAMIIKEVAQLQPLSVESNPVEYYLYNRTFNAYMDAYNYAITNMSPVTMVLPSNHPTMNNKRLMQLENEYTFSKMNMPYDNMVEYFNYIGGLNETLDKQDRYYKLKGWIERYNNRMNERNESKRILNEKITAIGNMIKDLKSIGMTIKENESYVQYYLNGEQIYIWFSGITAEKQYDELSKVYDEYYVKNRLDRIV